MKLCFFFSSYPTPQVVMHDKIFFFGGGGCEEGFDRGRIQALFGWERKYLCFLPYVFGKEVGKVEGKIINLPLCLYYYQGGWKSWVNLDILPPSSSLHFGERFVARREKPFELHFPSPTKYKKVTFSLFIFLSYFPPSLKHL